MCILKSSRELFMHYMKIKCLKEEILKKEIEYFPGFFYYYY